LSEAASAVGQVDAMAEEENMIRIIAVFVFMYLMAGCMSDNSDYMPPINQTIEAQP
jgi:hypothetical protein